MLMGSETQRTLCELQRRMSKLVSKFFFKKGFTCVKMKHKISHMNMLHGVTCSSIYSLLR